MKKGLLKVTAFFIATPLFIILCIVILTAITFEKQRNNLSFAPSPSVAYAALPSVDSRISASATQADSRGEIVRSFFHRYRSPLEPFAEEVVKYADMYGLDFRLVPAIGMQESNLCLKAPPSSNNCWGYGIYGKKVTAFETYSEAIQTVTKGLAHNYAAYGLTTPEQIMAKYTPSSNGSWARAVNQFMAELQ